jgi:hypothetical protein
MSLVDMFNVPNDPLEMARWSSLHAIQHRLTNFVILRDYNIALPEYILDPVNLADPAAFLDQHQQMHQNVDQLLGISGFDLTDVDWNDPGQRAGWIYLNAQLHTSEANATGAF